MTKQTHMHSPQVTLGFLEFWHRTVYRKLILCEVAWEKMVTEKFLKIRDWLFFLELFGINYSSGKDYFLQVSKNSILCISTKKKAIRPIWAGSESLNMAESKQGWHPCLQPFWSENRKKRLGQIRQVTTSPAVAKLRMKRWSLQLL